MADLLHRPTFRLNSFLILAYIAAAIVLGMDLPDRYPAHFDLAGNPTRWEERGAGSWILMVTISLLGLGKAHLFQRFLITDPNSTLINVPHKKLFHQLPVERKVPVLRRLNRMLGILNTLMLLLLLGVLLLVYYTAHNPDSSPVPSAMILIFGITGVTFGVIAVETVTVRRMIERKLREEGLLSAAGARP